MITNTDYGTWVNHGDQYNVSVEATLTDYLNGGDSEWCERVEASGALDAMARDYRDAINAALPKGVTLCGNNFYGPYYPADYTWDGELDISEIIEGIDLGAIVERHDPDNA